MQLNITQLKITGLFRTTLMVFTLLCLLMGKVNAQTYINGNISTGPVADNGTAAPVGYTWSEVQHPTGNTTVANNTIGANATGTNSVADDFIVPAGQTWLLSKFTTYGYSTNYAGATSPFTQLFIRIHSTNPLTGPMNIAFGDLTTNRMSATSDAMMYRISNTVAPAPLATNTARKIWKIEGNLSVVLAPGTYWIEYRVTAGALGNFMPLSTPLGVRTLPGYNALANTNGTWSTQLDLGFPTTAPDVNVDMPFQIDYSIAPPCTGTPDPGNTVRSVAAVCPGAPYTLSLQNNPPVAGLTYQWQSGPSVTGPFTNIAGATGSTYSSSTLAATSFFQAIVSCGANSDTSNPIQVTLNTPSQCYCVPTASDCTDGDIITNVRLANLNNTSGCGANGYTNYTTNAAIPVPSVFRGVANPMSVTAGNGLFTESVAAWIDYNQNGIFETTEFTSFGTTTGGTLTANLNVPATALLGNTRMRVRVRFATTLTGTMACTAYAFGETEDYLVNIVPCVQGVINTQPVNSTVGCSAGTSFSVGATGSLLTYQWEYRTSATGPWLLVPNAAPYSGVNTATLTIANTTANMTGYQYRAIVSGACTASDFTNAASLTVTPYLAPVSPVPAIKCVGTNLQLFASAPPSVTSVASGPLNIAIPDGSLAGPNHTLNVAGIPAGANISNISVRLNVTHDYVADLMVVLRAPNGRILQLSNLVGGTNNPGVNFTNTVFSSATGLPALVTGPPPYTGTYRPDAALAGAFGLPTGPTGFAANTALFSDLMSQPNGAWTIAMYDAGPPDAGTLVNWNIDITWGVIPATGVFSPNTNLFLDAAGTIPYTGTAVSSVYTNTTTNTTYSVVVNNGFCTSAPTNIPVTVTAPLTTVTIPATTNVCIGSTATITATAATGTPGAITYQWQVSTDNGLTYAPIVNGGIYSGANTATLSIANATSALNNNRYRAIASIAACGSSVTTNATTVVVNPNPVIVVSANPFTALTPGMTTTLSAAVSPNAGANYQWYLNGVLIPGATSNTYVADVDGLGEYTVTVEDVNGCSGTSGSISVTDSSSSIVFIYPSPNTGQFQVRYQSIAGNINLPRMLNVYDSKGARVYSQAYTIGAPYQRMDVDLRNHGKGVYMVELTDGNGQRIKAGRVVIF